MEPLDADQANQRLVDFLIAEGALWSPSLIAAFRATPRHPFLDRVFQYHAKTGRWREVLTRNPGAAELRLLYSDRALITHLHTLPGKRRQVPVSSSSQPSLMAQMLEDLQLESGQRVLEIGAGTGYNAALLAHVVGPDCVTSVDVDRNVLAEAWDHLRGFPERRVRLQHADGRQGFAPGSPYDHLMVTAATPRLEPAWLEQLAEDGRLSAPVVLAPGLAFVVCGTMRAGVFEGRPMRAAYFMPLRAEDESGSAEEDSDPASGHLQTLPAPWSEWLEQRRVRLGWQRLGQSLAFFGLLRGLTIDCRTDTDGQAVFGIGATADRAQCWLGARQWQIDSPEGRDLGWTLWRAFLDAGGPWPMEFRLRIAVRSAVPLSGRSGDYVRQVDGVRQVWDLTEPRQRNNWA